MMVKARDEAEGLGWRLDFAFCMKSEGPKSVW